MSKYARFILINGNQEIVELFDSRPEFTAEVMSTILEVPDNAEIGMIKSGQEFIFRQKTKDELKSFLKNYRLSIETGGFYLGQMFIESDDKSERRIIGAWAKAKDNPNYEVPNWKVGGQFLTLNSIQLIQIGDALNAHFQKCFNCERQTYDLIENDVLATEEEVSNKFDELFNA